MLQEIVSCSTVESLAWPNSVALNAATGVTSPGLYTDNASVPLGHELGLRNIYSWGLYGALRISFIYTRRLLTKFGFASSKGTAHTSTILQDSAAILHSPMGSVPWTSSSATPLKPTPSKLERLFLLPRRSRTLPISPVSPSQHSGWCLLQPYVPAVHCSCKTWPAH